MPPVEYTRDGPVAVITIDRPDRKNAIDHETAAQLGEAVDRFEAGDAAVAVLSGAGGTFSAGADLQAMDLEDGTDGWLGLTSSHG